jgi:hypothetical protein
MCQPEMASEPCVRINEAKTTIRRSVVVSLLRRYVTSSVVGRCDDVRRKSRPVIFDFKAQLIGRPSGSNGKPAGSGLWRDPVPDRILDDRLEDEVWNQRAKGKWIDFKLYQ